MREVDVHAYLRRVLGQDSTRVRVLPPQRSVETKSDVRKSFYASPHMRATHPRDARVPVRERALADCHSE